ncbi:oligosaccharide flippase family protein [Clostridium perfringens]|uniref:oligosaccharide flippase family protein n=1 Tax=Clostridium perfringens TaxID=1502 RepID=UPI0018E41A9B|nr:oligosaccharide flippase family protein [Clostridium perfringens]ELC8370424.1 oligosaccharide flippase family protein [Clostridium perfringens]ELC8374285.1 oligosaccharide flippase family protein [Clostridium perfringens]ELC8374591.1 oligosaccharide flippase family protein [Clostridium perfringens]MBI5983589.1 oligosaccharide flippase family protein [Clostridium perfringens]
MELKKRKTSIKIYIDKLKSSDVEGRMFRALVFSFIGAAFSKVLIMGINILLSRILGPEDYGKYTLVNSTIETFVTFSSMGLGASMVHYTAIFRKNEKEKCGQVMGSFILIIAVMSLFVTLVVIICSKPISIWTTKTLGIENLFKISAFIILSVSLGSIMQNILLGLERYKEITILEVVYGVIAIISTCLISIFYGVIGALIGLLLSRSIYAILLAGSAYKESKSENIRWNIKLDYFVWNIFKKFTFPSFMSSLFVIPVSWFLNALLVKNAGFYDMAVYSISLQWGAIVNYITSLFSRTKPIYTQLYGEKNYSEFKKQLWKMVKLSSVIGVSIAFVGIIFSKFILGVYGPEYVEQQSVFIIIMIATAVITIQSQFGSVFEAIGKMWIGFSLNLVWSANLIIIFLLLKQYGALGYSISYLIAYTIHCIYSWIVIAHILGKKEKNEAL